MDNKSYNSLSKQEVSILCRKLRKLIDETPGLKKADIGSEVFGKTSWGGQFMTTLLDPKKANVKHDQIQAILDHIGLTWDDLINVELIPGVSDMAGLFSGDGEPSKATEILLNLIWPNWKTYSESYKAALKTKDENFISSSVEAAKRDIMNAANKTKK